MTEPEFLLRDVVEYLHDQAIRAYGGHFGIRDEGLLESAVARPQQTFAYADPAPDLADLAAAYAFGISRNHPFVDGNKRAGWAACVLFLKVNGVSISATPAARLMHMGCLASGRLSESDFAAWIRARITRS